MQTATANASAQVINFSDFKAAQNQDSAQAAQSFQPQIIYVPVMVYYPVYTAQNAGPVEPVPAAIPTEEQKDNVVSIYDYLGEI